MAIIRRIRTPEGARRYRLPIGSPIVPRRATELLFPPVARLAARASRGSRRGRGTFEERFARAWAERPDRATVEAALAELPETADVEAATRRVIADKVAKAIDEYERSGGLDAPKVAVLVRAAAVVRPAVTWEAQTLAHMVAKGWLTPEKLADPDVAEALRAMRYMRAMQELGTPDRMRVTPEVLVLARRLGRRAGDPNVVLRMAIATIFADDEAGGLAVPTALIEALLPPPGAPRSRSAERAFPAESVMAGLREAMVELRLERRDQRAADELVARLSDPAVVERLMPALEPVMQTGGDLTQGRARRLFGIVADLPTREDLDSWLESAAEEGWHRSLASLATEVVLRRVDPERADAMNLVRWFDPGPDWPDVRAAVIAPNHAAVTAWRPGAVRAVLEAARRDGPTSELVRRAVECGPRLRSTDDLGLIARVPEGGWDGIPKAIRRDPEALERWLEAPGDWSEEERRWYARAGEVADAYRAARDGGAPHAEAVRQALGIDLERTPSLPSAAEPSHSASLGTRRLGRRLAVIYDSPSGAKVAKQDVAAHLAEALGPTSSVEIFEALGDFGRSESGPVAELLASWARLDDEDAWWVRASAGDIYEASAGAWVGLAQKSPFRKARWRSRSTDGAETIWQLTGATAMPVRPDEAQLAGSRLSLAEAMPQLTVARAIHQWAATANDAAPSSLYIQERAEALFGLEGAAPWSPDAATAEQLAAVRAIGADADVDRFLAAMWHRTQDVLDREGIVAVHGWRGWRWDEEERVPDWVRSPDVSSDVSPILHRPLASYSLDQEIAERFTSGSVASAVTAADIPAWRILSCPLSGFGCLGELEVVVLGGDLGPGVRVTRPWIRRGW